MDTYVFIPHYKDEIIEHLIARLGGTKSYWNKRKKESLGKLLWKVKKGYV